MSIEQLEIVAADQHVLRGTLWQTDAPRGVLLVHPATAVPERLYAAFAAYLTQCGFIVLTYDYRGIGRSRPRSLRGFDVRMRDWADLDVEAVTAWARGRFPALPIFAVGHSFGGHAIGLCASTGHLRAAVLVASHAGCLRFIVEPFERLKATLMLKIISPLTCAMLGFMPGRRLGWGEDLPAGVIREWSRWTSLRHYFFDDPSMKASERFSRHTLPLLIIGFDDDPWATRPAIDLLASHFSRAQVERRQISPRAAGAVSIGHMGFFRRQQPRQIWSDVADWLLAQIDSPRASCAPDRTGTLNP